MTDCGGKATSRGRGDQGADQALWAFYDLAVETFGWDAFVSVNDARDHWRVGSFTPRQWAGEGNTPASAMAEAMRLRGKAA